MRKYCDLLENDSNISSYNSNNCNCKSKIDCPMNGIFNLKNVVYQAAIFSKENVKDKRIFIGILSVRCKLRYNYHIHSFSHEHLKIK